MRAQEGLALFGVLPRFCQKFALACRHRLYVAMESESIQLRRFSPFRMNMIGIPRIMRESTSSSGVQRSSICVALAWLDREFSQPAVHPLHTIANTLLCQTVC